MTFLTHSLLLNASLMMTDFMYDLRGRHNGWYDLIFLMKEFVNLDITHEEAFAVKDSKRIEWHVQMEGIVK